jgi:hypothetical protein
VFNTSLSTERLSAIEKMSLQFGMSGGSLHKFSSDIGEVVSFVPRYHIGGGYSGLRHRQFRRPRLGRGFGSTILNFFKPLFKRGLTEVVDVASKVAGDVISGKSFIESAKSRALEKVASVLGGDQSTNRESDLVTNLNSPKGENKKRRITPATARRTPKTVKKSLKSVTGGGRAYRQKKVLEKYPALRFF